MKKQQYEAQAEKTLRYFDTAGIVLTDAEKAAVEVSDFGLDDLDNVGLQLIVYINTDRVCAKEMVLTPGQTCPEHIHVPTDGQPAKEETFRCRWGSVYLYVDGSSDPTGINAKLPHTPVTVFREIILTPGQQYTIKPGTWHWFQGGRDGAIVSEFSTHSTDETDRFTDERIVRQTKIEG